MLDPTKSKLAQALRLIADAIEAEEPQVAPTEDELLTLKQIRTEFDIGLDAMKGAGGRGEIKLLRGGRGRIMASRKAVVTWIESRPFTPRKRKAEAANQYEEPVDAVDQMVARGELRSVKGGKR